MAIMTVIIENNEANHYTCISTTTPHKFYIHQESYRQEKKRYVFISKSFSLIIADNEKTINNSLNGQNLNSPA